MKLPQTLYWLLAFVTLTHALALPAPFDIFENSRDLFKRKGGGGGRGGGSSGGSSGSSGGSSSSGSSGSGSSGSGSSGSGSSGSGSSGSGSSGSGSTGSGSSGSSGSTGSGSTGSSGGNRGGSSSSSSGSSSGLTSSTSNRGGYTPSGSGTTRSYGRGGGYYAGGASAPYSAGSRSPSGIAPTLLLGSALIFPGLWLYGAYAYPYSHPWTYHNNTSNMNETHPVECFCAQYASCGCDGNNTDTDFIESVTNNKSISQLVDVNGTETLVINGTLPNGTTAPGGTGSAAAHFGQNILQLSGWWVVVAGVTYTMWWM